jgi:hypothetical protein
MKFYNHCSKELYDEAERFISLHDWLPTYKEQLLLEVVDILARGQMRRRPTGAESIPWKVADVKEIVYLASIKDEEIWKAQ